MHSFLCFCCRILIRLRQDPIPYETFPVTIQFYISEARKLHPVERLCPAGALMDSSSVGNLQVLSPQRFFDRRRALWSSDLCLGIIIHDKRQEIKRFRKFCSYRFCKSKNRAQRVCKREKCILILVTGNGGVAGDQQLGPRKWEVRSQEWWKGRTKFGSAPIYFI